MTGMGTRRLEHFAQVWRHSISGELLAITVALAITFFIILACFRSLVRTNVDANLLKKPRNCRVVGDVFCIRGRAGGANNTQVAAFERRTQGIRRSRSSKCADELMKLIDEENYLPFGAFHFRQDSLQTSCKLAAILRMKRQGIEIETEQALVAQALRHIACRNSQRQALCNLSRDETCFPNQHRIIVCVARENLGSAANLRVAANHGLKTPLASLLR